MQRWDLGISVDDKTHPAVWSCRKNHIIMQMLLRKCNVDRYSPPKKNIDEIQAVDPQLAGTAVCSANLSAKKSQLQALFYAVPFRNRGISPEAFRNEGTQVPGWGAHFLKGLSGHIPFIV